MQDLIDKTNLREQDFSRHVSQHERFFQKVIKSCPPLKVSGWPADRSYCWEVRCSASGALSSSKKETVRTEKTVCRTAGIVRKERCFPPYPPPYRKTYIYIHIYAHIYLYIYIYLWGVEGCVCINKLCV